MKSTVTQAPAQDLLGSHRQVDLIYFDPPFNVGKNFDDFDDRWDSMDAYIHWLSGHIFDAWVALRAGGTFILHLDWHAVHYAKVTADVVFGYDQFVNEIIWKYNSGGGSTKRLSRKHDTLLVYVKDSGIPTFNTMREPYATPNVEGRPGFHPEGRVLTDVWEIPFISTTSAERVGYDTQKPLKLTDRIIQLYSNEGDLVLDPFCGSGTLGVSAVRAGRNYVGGDINSRAVEITQERLDAEA